ncbi:MAG: ATP-dependent Clp protease adaptor ClpS [Bacteroidales bacterium]
MDMEKEKIFSDLEETTVVLDEKQLMLYNDDVNTFDFVTQSLIEICRHEPEQAEQCTYIVHYKGKCVVRKGYFDELKTMYNELTRRQLTAKIL